MLGYNFMHFFNFKKRFLGCFVLRFTVNLNSSSYDGGSWRVHSSGAYIMTEGNNSYMGGRNTNELHGLQV